MACCPTAPSHYLNQCWLIISKVQRHSSQGNFTIDTSAINHWNYLENYLFKITFKSPKGQWVKCNVIIRADKPALCWSGITQVDSWRRTLYDTNRMVYYKTMIFRCYCIGDVLFCSNSSEIWFVLTCSFILTVKFSWIHCLQFENWLCQTVQYIFLSSNFTYTKYALTYHR